MSEQSISNQVVSEQARPGQYSAGLLFELLEHSGIRYAVLRNYEAFPNFGHDIDIVIHREDLPRFQDLLNDFVLREDWRFLIRCNHWNQSSFQHHNIEVFRFFKLNPACHMQVDVFHGYCLWGLPLFNEAELLEDRLYDNRGFTRIDPNAEHFFRLFQLQSLYQGQSGQGNKIERYRNSVLQYVAANSTVFNGFLDSYWPGFCRIISILEINRPEIFCQWMNRFKSRYFIRQLLCNPWQTLRFFHARLLSHARAYWLNPCGFIIGVYANDPSVKKQFLKIMDNLQKANLFTHWIDVDSRKKLWSWPTRKTLERGGVIIQWVKKASDANLDISQNRAELTDSFISEALIHHLISKHSVLAKDEEICHPREGGVL